MYRRFHDRFGTAGVVIAVIALIAALGGTAIAAGGLTAKQKKEVKKIAKSFQGTGPQGPQGLPGTNGTNGTNGKDGAQGLEGKEGKQGLEGKEGKEGLEGKEGKEGSPWTAGGTLPVGSTETGAWAMLAGPGGAGMESISFTIPLAAEIPAENAHVILVGGTPPAACDNGTGAAPSASNPEADSGHLCVFVAEPFGVAFEPLIFKPTAFANGASKTGAVLIPNFTDEGPGAGTWAVTG